MEGKQEKPLIMVVDDNEQILYLTKELLEIHDYQVKSFPDFLSALDFFKVNHTRITALLLDMQLKYKDDFLTNIPAFLAISETVPVICTSGSVNLRDIPEEVRIKIMYFFRKPYEIRQLLDLLATLSIPF